MKTSFLAAVVAGAYLVGVARPAAAMDSLRIERALPTSLAVAAALEAEHSCAAKGFDVTVTVVDRDGATRAVVAGDNSNTLKTEASRRKAYTAALLGQTTTEVAKAMPDAAQVLGPLDGNLLVAAGGLPIRAGGRVIGAIAVAGAPPGANDDEACGQAGLAKIAPSLN